MCEFCEDGKSTISIVRKSDCCTENIECEINNKHVAYSVLKVTDDMSISLKTGKRVIESCPMCGRKLVEK